MSIFSRLKKGGTSASEAPAPATPAAAATPPSAQTPAAAAPAKPPAPSPASSPSSSPAAKPAGPAGGQTRAYVAPLRLPGAAPAATSPATKPAAPAQPAASKTAPPASARAPAPASAPTPAPTPAREPVLTAESVEHALEKALHAGGAAADGASTAADRAAVMATFEDLAVAHTAQLRSVMMEVRWGEAQTSWIDLSRPSLRSLRAMAEQLGNGALTRALDGFDGALEAALQPGAPPAVSGATRDALLAAYAPLTMALPRAFELEGERDRREPLVVRALLEQVSELEPLMLDRMLAAGLGRLDALGAARADEVAVVAGLPDDVAAAVVDRVQAWKRATPAALGTLDPLATARELAASLQALQGEHRAFEDAAAAWSEASAAAKKQLRRRRQVTYLQITIALARLGEIDFALKLEKLPFARRIDELERFVRRNVSVVADKVERIDGAAGSGGGSALASGAAAP